MATQEITDLQHIKEVSRGEVVDLPPFLEGRPFVARLKKPSLLGLAAKGIIPNPLLCVAEGLFNGRMSEPGKEGVNFKETAEMFNIIAENALVEPTMAELEANGVFLTDMQYLAIFNYTQLGVKALSGFRSLQGDPADCEPQ